MEELLVITDNTIQNIITHWWQSIGYECLHKHMESLCQDSGEILRADHTYKVVNSLGVTNNKTWVCIKFTYLQ